MRVTPLDSINVRGDLGDIMQNNRKVVLLLPTLSNISSTSFDADTQTGYRSMAGDGTGRTAAWLIYEMYVMLLPVNEKLVTFGNIPPGVEQGDVLLTTGMQHEAVLEEAFGNEYHYLYIDKETFRIISKCYYGIGRREGVNLGCRYFTPNTFRCPGY